MQSLIRAPRLLLAAVLAGLFAVCACGSADRADPITPTAETDLPEVSEVSTTAAVDSAASTAAVDFPTPKDVKGWSSVPITAAFCGVPGSVQLSDFEATTQSSSWGKVHVFMFAEATDLTAPGRSTLLGHRASCDNGGGTAAGNIATSYLLFAKEGDNSRVFAELPAQQPKQGEHPTIVTDIARAGDTLTVKEQWYRSADPNCCASGTSESTWQIDGDTVRLVSARVLS
ncbi:LppP/LprE family lipoprotein [Gordonia mangrovi]|nr:LppP/LprE family lipoprotein [Gordonia mangrovi]UVF79178.1 LppP/LprE family lipoprotein [Gordonia mangrovi]